MPPDIEFCQQNVPADARRTLADIPSAAAKCCLQRCGTCYATPFLVVEGELRTGENHEALLKQIAEGIDE